MKKVEIPGIKGKNGNYLAGFLLNKEHNHINFDPIKPDYVQRKLLNSQLMNHLGSCFEVKLQHGQKKLIKNF